MLEITLTQIANRPKTTTIELPLHFLCTPVTEKKSNIRSFTTIRRNPIPTNWVLQMNFLSSTLNIGPTFWLPIRIMFTKTFSNSWMKLTMCRTFTERTVIFVETMKLTRNTSFSSFWTYSRYQGGAKLTSNGSSRFGNDLCKLCSFSRGLQQEKI